MHGNPLPKGLDIADSCLYVALKNLYAMHRNKLISRKDASEEKKRLMQNWTADKSKIDFLNRESDELRNKIGKAAERYKNAPCIENADELYAALYNLPNNWRTKKGGKIKMPKGVAYHVDEDPPEWIEECMQCPFDECVDCRYQASAYHCVTSIRGCMQEEKFISMYNSGEKPRTIGIAFGVPTSFVLSVIDVLKLPWKAGKIRPKISRTTMKSLPEKYQYLFC